MKAIWTAGEALCEIMRETCDVGLEAAGTFRGPFPSGAPAIFADTAAKLGCPSGLIGTVGDDAFGRCILKRFEQDGVDCSCVRVSGDLQWRLSPTRRPGTGPLFFTSETPPQKKSIVQRQCPKTLVHFMSWAAP